MVRCFASRWIEKMIFKTPLWFWQVVESARSYNNEKRLEKARQLRISKQRACAYGPCGKIFVPVRMRVRFHSRSCADKARLGKKATVEQRTAVSDGLKTAYREGRRTNRKRQLEKPCAYEPCGKIFVARWISQYGRFQNFCTKSCGLKSRSPEARARITKRMEASWANPQAREKRTASLKSAAQRPENRARHRTILLERLADPVELELWLASQRAVTSTFEFRSKIGYRVKSMWDDPDYRKRTSASIKAAKSTPESRARHSHAMNTLYANPDYYDRFVAKFNVPEYRIKRSIIAKALCADPKHREKIRETLLERAFLTQIGKSLMQLIQPPKNNKKNNKAGLIERSRRNSFFVEVAKRMMQQHGVEL